MTTPAWLLAAALMLVLAPARASDYETRFFEPYSHAATVKYPGLVGDPTLALFRIQPFSTSGWVIESSIDQGKTWTKKEDYAFRSGRRRFKMNTASRIAFHAPSDTLVVAGSVAPEPFGWRVGGVRAAVEHRDQQFIEANESVVFRVSHDRGATWTNFLEKYQIEGKPTRPAALTIDPAGNIYLVVDLVFEGKWRLLKKSKDSASWEQVTESTCAGLSSKFCTVGAIAVDGEHLYLAGSYGSNHTQWLIHVSHDAGRNWNYRDMETKYHSFPYQLEVDRAGNLYAYGTAHVAGYPHAWLRRSVDRGETWRLMLDEVAWKGIFSFSSQGRGEGDRRIFSLDAPYGYQETGLRLRVSDDGGETWSMTPVSK